MRLGIEATNVRSGGGIAHTVETLRHAEPALHGFESVVLWTNSEVAPRVEPRPWLTVEVVSSSRRVAREVSVLPFDWIRNRIAMRSRAREVDLVYAPGALAAPESTPTVAAFQNLLPFDRSESRRWGWTWVRARLLLLRFHQSRVFSRASGVICLSEYAREVLCRAIRLPLEKTAIVSCGVPESFRRGPRRQSELSAYGPARPFRILYVSTIDFYKHPWHVVRAIGALRSRGLPVVLELIGHAYPPALARLRVVLAQVDPRSEFVTYTGIVQHAELARRYHAADAFVFASTCETVGIPVLEAMAAGLPIACSNRRPMTDFLGQAAFYFDPESPDEIAAAIEALALDPDRRSRLAWKAFETSKAFTWERCARDTFAFLERVAANGPPSPGRVQSAARRGSAIARDGRSIIG